MSRHITHAALWSLLGSVVVGAGVVATSQSDNCADAISAVSAGSPADAELIGWRVLPACGEAGADAAAAGLRRLRFVADNEVVQARVPYVNGFLDPVLFSAATEVANDPSASSSARVHAILLLLAQHPDGGEASYANVASIRASGVTLCAVGSLLGPPVETSRQMPAGYAEQIRATVDMIRQSSASPEVRAAAQCVFRAVLPPLTASDIEARHLCGPFFEITNKTSEPHTVWHRGVGKEHPQYARLEAHSSSRLFIGDSTALEVFSDETVLERVPIVTVASSLTPCG